MERSNVTFFLDRHYKIRYIVSYEFGGSDYTSIRMLQLLNLFSSIYLRIFFNHSRQIYGLKLEIIWHILISGN